MREEESPAIASGTAETPKESSANLGSSFMAASLVAARVGGERVRPGAERGGVGDRRSGVGGWRAARAHPAEGVLPGAPADVGIVGPDRGRALAGRRQALQLPGADPGLLAQGDRRREARADVGPGLAGEV